MLDSLPLMKQGYSLQADMMFGWKPKIKPVTNLSIPLKFDLMDQYYDEDSFIQSYLALPEIFRGSRPNDTLELHK